MVEETRRRAEQSRYPGRSNQHPASSLDPCTKFILLRGDARQHVGVSSGVSGLAVEWINAVVLLSTVELVFDLKTAG